MEKVEPSSFSFFFITVTRLLQIIGLLIGKALSPYKISKNMLHYTVYILNINTQYLQLLIPWKSYDYAF